MHVIATQFTELRKQLNATFLERHDAIHAALLAILSGQHVFFLGPPGTAKSEMVRAIVGSIVNARYYEVALSKTKPIENVMGPLDLKRFREEGEYLIKREGYASAVEFVFFDEVGKMSPILGHDLLALTNERMIHEVSDGLSVREAPLSTAFTASNEMITDESDDAAALWDRLLFRVLVDYLQDNTHFRTLLTGAMQRPTVEIEWEALKDVITNVVPNIKISDSALEAILDMRKRFHEEGIVPSDRRWRASMIALKAQAFLVGRDEVIDDDIAVLRYTLWDTPQQVEKVDRLCMAAANPFVEPLFAIKAAIKEVDDGVTERSGLDANGNDQKPARQAFGKEGTNKLNQARAQLDTLLMEAGPRAIPGFKAVSDLHLTIQKRVFMVCLEQADDEAEIMLNKRRGSGDGGNTL